MQRLMTEQRVMKYLTRLPAMEDYPMMKKSFSEGDWDTAFRSSHTIKGVALNLGLTSLAKKASVLCDTVRHGAPTVDTSELLEDVCVCFENVCSAIKDIEI